jgi:hypothetical protein
MRSVWLLTLVLFCLPARSRFGEGAVKRKERKQMFEEHQSLPEVSTGFSGNLSSQKHRSTFGYFVAMN